VNFETLTRRSVIPPAYGLAFDEITAVEAI